MQFLCPEKGASPFLLPLAVGTELAVRKAQSSQILVGSITIKYGIYVVY